MIKSILNQFKPNFWLNKNLTPNEIKAVHFHYSQLGEDILLESMIGTFKMEGFYVDVGAHHPFKFSNTHLFYKKGWRGINVEANPSLFKNFELFRPDEINLNIGVSDVKSRLKFACCGGYSGIVDEKYPFLDKCKPSDIIEIQTITLSEILDKHLPKDTKIDFLTIDCEGHDINVLQSNNWEKYRPDFLLVEQDENSITKIHDYLRDKRYHFLCCVGVTCFYLEEKIAAERIPENR